jgi:hypothetical protein
MTNRFLALAAVALVWGIVVWVGRWTGTFRSERARKQLAWGTGWFLGGAAVSGAFALIESPAWWWVRNAVGDMAWLFGAAVGALLAGHYFELRRAAAKGIRAAAREQADAANDTLARMEHRS